MDKTGEPKDTNAFLKWKHSYSGRVAWIVLSFAIAYVFGSLAVNSGALWQWGVAVLFVGDGIYNIARLLGKLYGRDKATKA